MSGMTGQGWRSASATEHALLPGREEMQWALHRHRSEWVGSFLRVCSTGRSGKCWKVVFLLFLCEDFQVENPGAAPIAAGGGGHS